MNLIPLVSFFLPLVSIVFLVAAEETNNRLCNFGADAIPGFKRTCIASTAYEGKRCFYTYIPECAQGSDSDSPGVPLVFDIHGYGSCPLWNTYYTGWQQKADENCFVLVMPTVSPKFFHLMLYFKSMKIQIWS